LLPGPPPRYNRAMPDFWRDSGFHLLARDARGHLAVGDDFLRAYLMRPEVRPGEIKYLGAFWYAHKPGFFTNEFYMAAVEYPSPETVLRWAIEATGGTDWALRLQQSAGKSQAQK
jgi:hypothetical protein